jgi:hypothetical protein
MPRYLIAAALLLVALASTGANAQFGSIFGAPPRPPAGVPNGNRQPDPQYQQQAPDNYPPPPSNPRAGVQSQPLPPPPGVNGAGPLPPSQSTSLPPSGSPPGQRPPPRGAPQPADTSQQPDDQLVAEPPAQKVVNTSALFSGLDKITGRIINFDVAIGETVQFGALQVTPRACYTRPATEATNTDAFVEVDEVTLQGEVKRIFTGWMFAASPGLHGVEHAIYDVWLTNCKGAAQTVTAAPPPDPTPPPRTPPTPQRPQQPAQQRRPPPTPPR